MSRESTTMEGSRQSTAGDALTQSAVDWSKRQWQRYDQLIESFTTHSDYTTKRALCLAFVKSVLNDKATEKLFAEMLFEATNNFTTDCEEAIGRDNVAKVKVQLLLLLWSLPVRQWQCELFNALGDYCSRDNRRPVIPFRSFLGSTLRMIARRLVNPLADVVEKWL